MVLARSKSSKIKGLVEHELSKRQANRATYEQELSIKGKSREEASSISDYLFEHKKSWNETKKQQILQNYPTVKTFYDFLVPDPIRERDFWERYGYRCDEGRIRKYFESLTPKQVEQQVEQITERKEEEKGRVYQLPKGKAMSVQLLNQLSPRSKKNQSASDKVTPSYDRSKLRKSVTSVMVANALKSSIEKEKDEEPSPAPFSRSMLRSTKEGQALVANDEDEQMLPSVPLGSSDSMDQEPDDGEKEEDMPTDEAGEGHLQSSSLPADETTDPDNTVPDSDHEKEQESEVSPKETNKESSGVSSEDAAPLDTVEQPVDAQMVEDITSPTQTSEEAANAVKVDNETAADAPESYSRQLSNLMKAKKASSGDLASADKPAEIVEGDGNMEGVPIPQPTEVPSETIPDDSELDSKLPVDEPKPEPEVVDQEESDPQPTIELPMVDTAVEPKVEPTAVEQEENDAPPTSEPTAAEAEVEPTAVDQEGDDVQLPSEPTTVEAEINQTIPAEVEPVMEESKQEPETAGAIEEPSDDHVPEIDEKPDEMEELMSTSAPSPAETNEQPPEPTDELQQSVQEETKPNLSVSTGEIAGEEQVEPVSDDVALTDELEATKKQPDILTRVTEAVFSPRTLKEARRMDQSDVKVLLQKKLNELGIVPAMEVPEKSTLKEESDGVDEPSPDGTKDAEITENEQSVAEVVHEATETAAVPETIPPVEAVERLGESNQVEETLDSPQQQHVEVSESAIVEPPIEVPMDTEELPPEAPANGQSDKEEQQSHIPEAVPETETFADAVVPEETNGDNVGDMEEDAPIQQGEDDNGNTLEVVEATTESNDTVDTNKEEKEVVDAPKVEQAAEPSDEKSLTGELPATESVQSGNVVDATTEALGETSTHSQPYDEKKQKAESGGSGIWGMFRASITKPAAKPRQLSLEEEKAKQLALLQEQMGNMADIAESMDAQSKIVAAQPKAAGLASGSAHEVNNKSDSKGGWNVMGIFGDSNRSLNHEPSTEQATEENVTTEEPSDDTKGTPVEEGKETNATSDPERELEPVPEPESQSENAPEPSQEAEPTIEPQPNSVPESAPAQPPAASQKEAGFMGLGSWFGGGKGQPKKEENVEEKGVEAGAVEAKVTSEPAMGTDHNKGFGVLSMFGVGGKEADKESATVPGAEEPTEESAIEEPKVDEEDPPSAEEAIDSPKVDEASTVVDEEPTSTLEETVDSEPPVGEQTEPTSSTSPDAPLSQETENTDETEEASEEASQSQVVVVPQESTEIPTTTESANVGTPSTDRPKLSAEERAAKRLRIMERMNALDELCRAYRSACVNGTASKAPAIASNKLTN